jgi:hypothetical protein
MRILFISFMRHSGIQNGGDVANLRNIKMAQQLFGEDNVECIYLHDDTKRRPLSNYLQTFEQMPRGYYNGLTPGFVRKVVAKAFSYDCVFLNTSLFGMIARRLKESGYQGRIISHFHNVESIYYDALLSRWMPGRGVIIRCAAKNDRMSCQYADKIITLTKCDSDILQKKYNRSADIIAGIALTDQFRGADEDCMIRKRPLCLFIGSSFTANNEGIIWFVQNVLPHVAVDFKVVGKGMSKLKEDTPCLKNIDVVSDAPSLAPYFAEADFMVLPIFAGSGMKVKTCECLMYGRNILGTNETFEGYEINDKCVGGRCNTAEEFIATLNRYIQHPIKRFNRYSRQLFLDKYTEEQSKSLFKSLFA